MATRYSQSGKLKASNEKFTWRHIKHGITFWDVKSTHLDNSAALVLLIYVSSLTWSSGLRAQEHKRCFAHFVCRKWTKRKRNVKMITFRSNAHLQPYHMYKTSFCTWLRYVCLWNVIFRQCNILRLNLSTEKQNLWGNDLQQCIYMGEKLNHLHSPKINDCPQTFTMWYVKCGWKYITCLPKA